MENPSKIWYFFKGGNASNSNLDFYKKEQFPWTEYIEEHASEIASEVAIYLETNEEKIKPYFNISLVSKKSVWKTSAFYFWLFQRKKNMKQCPKTMEILEKIPGILSASISILEANSEIKPHIGDTNATVRCHLGLKVPAGLPDCGFRVGYEDREWREGELLLFNDAARHTAWNHTEKRRYVLLFDVLKPEYEKKKYTVSSLVLSGLVMQSILQKLPFLNYFPRIFLGIALYFNSFLINIMLRVRRAIL